MTSTTGTYALTLAPALLEEGFWLYVIKIKTKENQEYLYVGRTGDTSSPNSAAPIKRLSQHLGSNKNNNSLQRHIDVKQMSDLEFIAHGPVFPAEKHLEEESREIKMARHKEPLGNISALECKLAQELKNAGYNVLNEVRSNATLNESKWQEVKEAFAKHFDQLKTLA
jgi:hypothetical protein